MRGTILNGVLVARLVLCGLLAGCGTNAEEPEITTETLTAEGWDLFETGDYAHARWKFEQAIDQDDSYTEAYSGLGWSVLSMDSLEGAVSTFEAGITRGARAPDLFAGQAVAYRDLGHGHSELAIVSADSALSRSPRYVFSHAPTFDWQDLRLILAQSHFALGQYSQAKAQTDTLHPSNQIDPHAATFIEDLLTEIQNLGREIVGS